MGVPGEPSRPQRVLFYRLLTEHISKMLPVSIRPRWDWRSNGSVSSFAGPAVSTTTVRDQPQQHRHSGARRLEEEEEDYGTQGYGVEPRQGRGDPSNLNATVESIQITDDSVIRTGGQRWPVPPAKAGKPSAQGRFWLSVRARRESRQAAAVRPRRNPQCD